MANDGALQMVAKAMANSAIFRVFPEPARLRLATRGREQTFEAGSMVCRVGDAGDAAYIVMEGELEVRVTSLDGRDVRIASLMSGGLAGEMAALDGGSRSADMAAVRRTRVWRIPRQALAEALESEPKAAMALIAELCGRIRGANAALETSALLDLGGRLARLLLHERNGRDVAVLTQTEMARRIGASRESVNRKLRKWAEHGWVKLLPIGVVLANPQFLLDLVATTPDL
jgi:CRP-like cAMP-binding protein